jgi:hypothetical protein
VVCYPIESGTKRSGNSGGKLISNRYCCNWVAMVSWVPAVTARTGASHNCHTEQTSLLGCIHGSDANSIGNLRVRATAAANWTIDGRSLSANRKGSERLGKSAAESRRAICDLARNPSSKKLRHGASKKSGFRGARPAQSRGDNIDRVEVFEPSAEPHNLTSDTSADQAHAHYFRKSFAALLIPLVKFK